MRYIIMCGGKYSEWETPKHLTKIHGEEIVARTIRLLKENGVEDIAISSNDSAFEKFGVPVLKHENDYQYGSGYSPTGYWCEAFYPTNEPTCYIFGDVVFSPEAIKRIVEAETNDIELFGSMQPFAENYPKKWIEPFALKVVDTNHLKQAIARVKKLDAAGRFKRRPIMWELWAVIKGTNVNKNRRNWTAINDYTCDIDTKDDIAVMEKIIPAE